MARYSKIGGVGDKSVPADKWEVIMAAAKNMESEFLSRNFSEPHAEGTER